MKNQTKFLSASRNGVIMTKELAKENIGKHHLKKALDEEIIQKVAHGIYIEKNELEDNFYIFQLRYKRLVFSYLTAAYLHGLTTRIVVNIYASAPQNYHVTQLKNKCFVVREKEEHYQLGITEINTPFDNMVRVHDVERTVCDFYNPKYMVDKFVQVEVLKNYLNSEKRDLNKLSRYADVLGVLKELRTHLEVLL